MPSCVKGEVSQALSSTVVRAICSCRCLKKKKRRPISLISYDDSPQAASRKPEAHICRHSTPHPLYKLVSIDAATRILSYSELSNICPPPNSKKTRRFKKLVSIDAATRILSYSELSNTCPPPKLEKKTRRFKRTRPSVTLSIMQLECNILKPTLSSWLQPRVLILR